MALAPRSGRTALAFGKGFGLGSEAQRRLQFFFGMPGAQRGRGCSRSVPPQQRRHQEVCWVRPKAKPRCSPAAPAHAPQAVGSPEGRALPACSPPQHPQSGAPACRALLGQDLLHPHPAAPGALSRALSPEPGAGGWLKPTQTPPVFRSAVPRCVVPTQPQSARLGSRLCGRRAHGATKTPPRVGREANPASALVQGELKLVPGLSSLAAMITCATLQMRPAKMGREINGRESPSCNFRCACMLRHRFIMINVIGKSILCVLLGITTIILV